MRSTHRPFVKLLSADEEGKANWSHQSLKPYQQQRKTKGTMEISQGMHGNTFEVVTTFQQSRTRAKKLLAKAADAVVQREAIGFHREVQEEIGDVAAERVHTVREHRIHQQSDQGGEARRLVEAGHKKKFVGLARRHTEKMCQKGAVE